MHRCSRLLLIALCLCPVVLAPPAAAQEPPAAAPATPAVKVQIAVVRASRGAQAVDGELAPMAQALARLPFQTFRSLGVGTWTATVGAAHTETLPAGIRAEATVKRADADGVSIDVALFRDGAPVTSTTITRPWDGTHVLQAGTYDADALLVGVRVSR